MDVIEFLNRLDGVKGGNGKWTACCPCSRNHSHNDRSQSLSIAVGNDGRILLKCHKGCPVEEITSAMGLQVSDLFPDKPAAKPESKLAHPAVPKSLSELFPGLGPVIAEYPYHDASGHLLAKKLRYEPVGQPKTFRWCRPAGNDKWLSGRGDVPHRLFVAGKLEDTVYIVEGEKDALTMQKLDLNACSAADGAGGHGKWRPEYTEQLKSESYNLKFIFILPDNDSTGHTFAQEAAAAVYGICPTVKILDLAGVWPEIPDKGDISDMVEQFGVDQVTAMLMELKASASDWTPETATDTWQARKASTFGENRTRFLWTPYLPIGDYSVVMADGGTGKTILCCGIAAAISTGTPLPGELPEPGEGEGKNVLIISGEDSGEVLKERLELSGADTDRIYIIDRSDSIGITFSDGYEKFVATIRKYHPALVVIDPWHNFLGEQIDISRVNALRPVLQKMSNMAKQCDCAIIMVSHVNKRAQAENANNAATGSVDFINASRSAMRLIFDETDDTCRILVHTKSNYADYGQSVRYRIEGGGLVWDGFSDITRATLEQAARQRSTPGKLVRGQEQHKLVNTALIQALETEADAACPQTVRFSYDEFRDKYGGSIFRLMQPKRALDAVKAQLEHDGYFLKTGVRVIHGGYNGNGFAIQKPH